jgi:tRNA 2-thiouridine synthesizing protein E
LRRDHEEEKTVTTMTLANQDLDVDAEGFLKHAEQWTEAVAEAIAKEAGIEPLTDRHWQVVRFMRDRFLATGSSPSIRTLGKESGVPVKELYQLFPKGPAKLAAKIGGIPKPKGCI